ncbi:hypothetical protein DFJ73DRAFT_904529 [Zopfochytrium polystomum]|nr:hypothetical protein DFJ73DRAFT_904529 [Zopfochytrium polystomum]
MSTVVQTAAVPQKQAVPLPIGNRRERTPPPPTLAVAARPRPPSPQGVSVDSSAPSPTKRASTVAAREPAQPHRTAASLVEPARAPVCVPNPSVLPLALSPAQPAFSHHAARLAALWTRLVTATRETLALLRSTDLGKQGLNEAGLKAVVLAAFTQARRDGETAVSEYHVGAGFADIVVVTGGPASRDGRGAQVRADAVCREREPGRGGGVGKRAQGREDEAQQVGGDVSGNEFAKSLEAEAALLV